jgi:hypothetical protein
MARTHSRLSDVICVGAHNGTLRRVMNESVQKTNQASVATLEPPNRMRALIVLALTVVVLVFSCLLTMPFVPALTWALALAIVFAPSHGWVERKAPSLAAFISVFWIALIVVVPTIWIGSLLIIEMATGAAGIKDKAALFGCPPRSI